MFYWLLSNMFEVAIVLFVLWKLNLLKLDFLEKNVTAFTPEEIAKRNKDINGAKDNAKYLQIKRLTNKAIQKLADGRKVVYVTTWQCRNINHDILRKVCDELDNEYIFVELDYTEYNSSKKCYEFYISVTLKDNNK